MASLLGAAAALLLVWSMLLFLDEIGGDNQRIGGLIVSLLFLLAGAGLMLLAGDRRSANAGVGLSAVAVIPLLIHVFVDVRSPGNTFGPTGDITGTTTAILLLAAAIWLVVYFIGPSGRHGLLLGAALVALWLVGVVQVADGSAPQVTSPVETTFTPIGNSIDDPLAEDPFTDDSWADDAWADDPWADDAWADDSWPDDEWADDPWADDQDNSIGEFGETTWEVSSSGEVNDPSTRLGLVSLVFGGVYLALGAMGDRRDRARHATPMFAASMPILTIAVLFLGDTLDVEGSAMLAIALGSAAAWIGSRSTRRFTSWYGTAGAALGLIALVSSTASGNELAQAIVLLVLGAALAVAATALDGGQSGPDGPRRPASDPDSDPVATDHGPPPTPVAWSPPGDPYR